MREEDLSTEKCKKKSSFSSFNINIQVKYKFL